MSPCNICKQKGADLPIWDDVFFPTFCGANPPTHPEKKKNAVQKNTLACQIGSFRQVAVNMTELYIYIHMKQSPKGAILSIQTSQ